MLGLVTAPLAGAVIKPLLRGTVKLTVGIGLQVKKLAAEAREEFQDLTAEANAEIATAETAARSNVTVPKVTPPKRV
ncbi:MAG: DUF5132 domain-containing protein [Pseudonocardiales bacterium]|nr:MAG: DUF5132 domain-containing protein [Pseudonocardiales bacterium]